MKKTLFTTLALLVAVLLVGQTKVKPFKFALITDTHIGNPNNDIDLQRTVDDINQNLPEIEFVSVSCDVTEFG